MERPCLEATKKEMKKLLEIYSGNLEAINKELTECYERREIIDDPTYQLLAGEKSMLLEAKFKLQAEYDSAVVTKPLKSSFEVSFGSEVTLFDYRDMTTSSYLFLGPYDKPRTDSILGDISNLFGRNFVGKKVGDIVEFDSFNRHHSYRVMAIR